LSYAPDPEHSEGLERFFSSLSHADLDQITPKKYIARDGKNLSFFKGKFHLKNNNKFLSEMLLFQ
jgi:hypothetical protein